jgi:alpha-beta hydrolase superfamily lysophospholipase
MKHNKFDLQTVGGQKLYAQEWVPEGTIRGLVCLVHGLGEHSGRYAHLAKYFTESGFALLAFDLRGHGKSDGRRGHSPGLPESLEDISLFLETADDRYPGHTTFLYGHSLGGNFGLNFAIRDSSRPKAFIVTSPILRPAFEPPSWKVTLGRTLYRILPTFAMSNELDREALSRDPQVVRSYNEDPQVHDRVTARLAIDMLDSGLWLLENAHRLRHPTLLVHGNADRVCSVDASKEFASRAGELCHLKIWDGLFHETHNEPEKDEVIEYTLNWMKGYVGA